MINKEMNLSVVIVSWNTKALTEACLRSVYDSLVDVATIYEIWVVDNASTDGTPEMIRREFPNVRLIENKKNFGFAGGNNQAIRRCTGKFILLLNPDTCVLRDGIERLTKFMEKNPRAGAAGSRLLNDDGSLQISCYPFPTLAKELWRLLHLDRLKPYGVYEQTRWSLSHPHPTEVIQGASLILRRETIDEVGLLDEEYFMYTEEVDLCFRIAKAGWDLWWVPGSQVIHYGGQSTSQVAGQMFLCLYQSKLQFFRKFYGRIGALLYKCILIIASLYRLSLAPLSWLQSHETRSRNLQVAQNYWHMLAQLNNW